MDLSIIYNLKLFIFYLITAVLGLNLLIGYDLSRHLDKIDNKMDDIEKKINKR